MLPFEADWHGKHFTTLYSSSIKSFLLLRLQRKIQLARYRTIVVCRLVQAKQWEWIWIRHRSSTTTSSTLSSARSSRNSSELATTPPDLTIAASPSTRSGESRTQSFTTSTAWKWRTCVRRLSVNLIHQSADFRVKQKSQLEHLVRHTYFICWLN